MNVLAQFNYCSIPTGLGQYLLHKCVSAEDWPDSSSDRCRAAASSAAEAAEQHIFEELTEAVPPEVKDFFGGERHTPDYIWRCICATA